MNKSMKIIGFGLFCLFGSQALGKVTEGFVSEKRESEEIISGVYTICEDFDQAGSGVYSDAFFDAEKKLYGIYNTSVAAGGINYKRSVLLGNDFIARQYVGVGAWDDKATKKIPLRCRVYYLISTK